MKLGRKGYWLMLIWVLIFAVGGQYKYCLEQDYEITFEYLLKRSSVVFLITLPLTWVAVYFYYRFKDSTEKYK